MQRLLSLILVLSSLLTSLSAQPLAFPGAEGYGCHATGGRGGQVLIVTNLNDSGEGSLRWAVEQSGPRIITFAVSGTIELQSPLRINNDDVSILGQTAPGQGICLKDYPLVVNASNAIVRYLHVRVGDRHQLDSDGVGGGRYGQHDVILDHLSVSWSIDECLSIYKTERLTVQWCLISHSLSRSVHTKGSHGFGGIWGGYKATFHHNLLANHSSRNPRFASVDGTKWVDYRNNVVYNWGFKSAYGGGHHGEINFVGNYYKPGPASQHHKFLDVAEDGTGRYYLQGNVMEGDDAVTLDNRLGVGDRPGVPYLERSDASRRRIGINPEAIPEPGDSTSTCLVEEAFPFYPIAQETPKAAYEHILEQVGCSRNRDSYDAEVLRQMQLGLGLNGRDGIIDHPADVGGWPRLKAGKAPRDSDRDGMPDRWERQHGLNPHDPADASSHQLSPLYTCIELYANSLVR